MICSACYTPINPIWTDMGFDRHPSCNQPIDCDHGEPRGPRYCALCRRANPNIQPPVPPQRERRRKKVAA